MNTEDIQIMFEGITEPTKDIIVRRLREPLKKAIAGVNTAMKSKSTLPTLTPQPKLIMNAFRLCPIETARVVIIGQDPYIKTGEAMGLSFSVPSGIKIPPSLDKIYECLIHCGEIKTRPVHGDLTLWAKQGVLLINAALTTIIGTSNEHASLWQEYTDALLKELSALPQQLIFILLGGFARGKAQHIDKRKHVILEWGHPSPVNSANQTDNPKNFKYCTAFTRANNILITRAQLPINWSPDETSQLSTQADDSLSKQVSTQLGESTSSLRELSALDPIPLTYDTLWVFTDGAAKKNGKAGCTASWAFYLTDGYNCIDFGGAVEPVDIPGEVYKTSNNRGELTAILRAFEFILSNHIESFAFEKIQLVSDSEYAIESITQRAATCKLNADLIVATYQAYIKIRENIVPVTLRHLGELGLKSHGMKEPIDNTSEEWFWWRGNQLADSLCQKYV